MFACARAQVLNRVPPEHKQEASQRTDEYTGPCL